VRKAHVVKRAAEDVETEKEEAAKGSFGWLSKVWSLVFYLGLGAGLFMVVFPPLMFNYIKGQIQTGEWVNVHAPPKNTTANITSEIGTGGVNATLNV
jgi:hypothetical protein